MIRVHGHRGARARRPENTLPAFQHAIAQGADFVELDVLVTKDNVVVVAHDPVINGTICSGPRPGIPIRLLTLDELRQYECGSKKNPDFPDQVSVPGARIPTLDEVFDLGRGNSVEFNVETKISAEGPELTPEPETFARMILDVISAHKLRSRVMLQSFDPRTLRAMKRLDPAIRRGALFEAQGPPDAAPNSRTTTRSAGFGGRTCAYYSKEERDWMEVAVEFEATLLCPEHHLVTAEKVTQAHSAGFEVVPWTANLPCDWERLAGCGVDAIITDDPESLIAWLRTGPR